MGTYAEHARDDEQPARTLARRLRASREEAGLSVIELARRSGVSRPYLYELEDERRLARPSADVLLRLAAAIGIGTETLLGDVASDTRRPVPPSLRAYLERGESTPVAAQLLRVIAGHVPGETTVDDWQFLNGSLERTVLRAGARRSVRRVPAGVAGEVLTQATTGEVG